MDWLDLIRKNFEKSLAVMQKALEQARIAQKNAPSAMESHSDTTRSEKEKLVTAIEINMVKLKRQIAQILQRLSPSDNTVQLWRHVNLESGGQPLEVILVPDGMGGGIINYVRLISESTPLGTAIRDKQIGSKFELNGKTISILSVG